MARAAALRPNIDCRVVATGQHGALFDEALAAFDVGTAEHLHLADAAHPITGLSRALDAAMPDLLARHQPDIVLVQGDTTSARAAAEAAARCGVPVGHVEAGLRSGDPLLPWPEEGNRIAIDAIADLLFAPSAGAAENLRREGVPGGISITGNSGVDALLMMRDRASAARLHDSAFRLILATVHRRDAIGPPLERICAALALIARRDDVRIALPVHPNPRIGGPVRAILGRIPRVDLIDPLPYPDMIALLDRAHLVLSDSGGLQEEAPALGVPMLALRDNSERPEVIAAGNVRLVGSKTATILATATELLDDPAAHAAMARPAFPYGRGDAADAILDTVEDWHRAPGLAARAARGPSAASPG